MEAYSPSEEQSAAVNKAAHLGRVAERIDRISHLKSLLQEKDAATIVAALRQGGYSVEGDGFEEKSLEEVKAAIAEGVGQMEAWNNEVAGLSNAVKNGLVGTVTNPASLDVLDTELAPEQVEIDARLQSLVVAPINALPETKRTVRGRVRSGEEIARAIPDVEAFLGAVNKRKEGKFFELNEAGQLVIEDGCSEAYGLGENFITAKVSQTCVYYRREDGTTQSMEGGDYYTVEEVDSEKFGVRGKVKVLKLSEAAKKIASTSITMKSGLPTLKGDGKKHTGEYARMNTGQFEKEKYTWTDDDSLGSLGARCACWFDDSWRVHSHVRNPFFQDDLLGSRGVLRVNLNLSV